MKKLEEKQNKLPDTFSPVPQYEWPNEGRRENLIEVWMNRYFLVQIYREENGVKRLSILRAALKNDMGWADRITWDELQEIKNQCGFSDMAAVEVFPPSCDVVNVANMRHLWVLPSVPSYCWRKS